jgi:hypothetical protein
MNEADDIKVIKDFLEDPNYSLIFYYSKKLA